MTTYYYYYYVLRIILLSLLYICFMRIKIFINESNYFLLDGVVYSRWQLNCFQADIPEDLPRHERPTPWNSSYEYLEMTRNKC